MKKIIEYFIDRSFLVNMLTASICVFGLIDFLTINRDLAPPIEFPLIHLTAVLPGASPVDMERQVTFPIEEALADMPDIERITSATGQSSTLIQVFVKMDVDDLQRTVEKVRARVDGLADVLPRDLEPIRIQAIEIESMPVVELGIQHFDHNDLEHRRWAELLKERLADIPHIVKVDTTLRARDIVVELDPAKLEAEDISLSHARQRILEYLRFLPIGSIEADEETIAVEVDKGFDSVDALRGLYLTSNRLGRGIPLGSVAQVDYQFQDKRVIEKLNGDTHLQLTPYKDMTSDMIRLKGRIMNVVEEFKKKMPPPLELTLVGDIPFLIEKQMSVMTRNVLFGMALVLVLLVLFLGPRIALMTAVGLPVCYFGTFMVMDYLGISVNLISVMALLLVLGILVDDAILISEGFCQNLEKGMAPREAAVSAAHTLFVPITGTILTTVIAFAPILFVKSWVSVMLFSLPVIITSTLFISWLESILILPNHLKDFMRKEGIQRRSKVFQRFKELYVRVLRRALKLRYLCLLGLLALLGLSIYIGVYKMEKKFKSFHLSAERVRVIAVLPESRSLEETQEKIAAVEELVAACPQDKLLGTFVNIGMIRIKGRQRKGFRYAEIMVVLSLHLDDAAKERDRIKKDIDEKLKGIGGFEELYTLTDSGMGEQGEEEDLINIYVSGGDKLAFEELLSGVEAELKHVPNVASVYIEKDNYQTTWRFQPDYKKLLAYKMSASELVGQLQGFFKPAKLLTVRLSGEMLRVYVRFPEARDLSLRRLGEIKVVAPNGVSVPTRFLGTWVQARSLNNIKHVDQLRRFVVNATYDRKTVKKGDVMDAMDKKLEPLRERFPGYTITVERMSREEKEGKAWIIKVIVLCLGLMYAVLCIVLGSLTQPFLVMLAIPFGIIGVILAFYLHGMALNIIGMIGIVGMAGVVVNDSLVMVAHINTLRSSSKEPFLEQLVLGASDRLRAIILTTVTTLGGIFPMAYGLGGKVGYTEPMVFAMGWALAFATVLTLVVLPCTLLILDDARRLLRWAWNKVPIPRR